MKPLTVTERYRLRDLKITQSTIVPKGKVIWWQGRKRLSIDTFDRIKFIPSGADGVQVSVEDHAELHAELYPPRYPKDILAAG